jgi:predicted dehydrogenase
MNIYGKEATAFYDLHNGLRLQKRNSEKVEKISTDKNDAIMDELDEFAAAVRGEAEAEMDGERSTESLAVILAGIKSAKEGRRVEVAEVLK